MLTLESRKALENGEVFITEAKLKSVVESIIKTTKPYAVQFKDLDLSLDLELDLKKILTVKEINLLAMYQLLCLNPNDVFKKYSYLEKTGEESPYTFISNRNSYHLDPQCKALHSDFSNVLIPAEIAKKNNPELIQEYRDFAQKHRSLYLTDPERFCFKVQAHFMLKKDLKIVSFDNSGHTTVVNHDLEAVEAKIKKLLDDAEAFRLSNPATERTIRNLGFGTHKRPEANQPGHVLYIWHHQFKVEIKNLLQTYFRVKFNPELKFSGRLLEQLGFKKCRACATQHLTNL